MDTAKKLIAMRKECQKALMLANDKKTELFVSAAKGTLENIEKELYRLSIELVPLLPH